MHRWRRMLAVGGMLLGLSGCQCCFLTEPYADLIDCIADREHCLDPLYRPWYDLTRIGRSDWCACPVNRLLCPCGCERCKPIACPLEYEYADYRTWVMPPEAAPAAESAEREDAPAGESPLLEEDAAPGAPQTVPPELQLPPDLEGLPPAQEPQAINDGPVFLLD